MKEVFSDLQSESKEDMLILDYPVSGYTTKAGIKKKAHTRGESQKIGSSLTQTQIRFLKREIESLSEYPPNLEIQEAIDKRKKEVKELKESLKPKEQKKEISEVPKKRVLTDEEKERIKEIRQYPYGVQKAIKFFLNLMKMKLTDIKQIIVHNSGRTTIRDKKGNEHKFDAIEDFFSETDESDFDEELEDLKKIKIKKLIDLGIRLFHGGDIDPQSAGKFSWLTEFESNIGDGSDVFFLSPYSITASEYGDLYELDLKKLQKDNPSMEIYFDINPNSRDLEFVIETDSIDENDWNSIEDIWLEGEDYDPKRDKELFNELIESSGKGKGWHGESERHSQAAKKGKRADFKKEMICDDCKEKKKMFYQKLCKDCYKKRVDNYVEKYDITEDVKGRPKTKKGLTKGSKSAQVSGAKRTKEGQALIKAYGKEIFELQPKIKPLDPNKFSIPFSMLNVETGAVILGERIENLLGTEKQLTPVSSSNVRAVGQLGQELLVQFHTSGKQTTYRYQFPDQVATDQAFKSLMDTGSPGRWVWHNIRGHKKGEAIPKSKLGPAITDPSKEVIGGTSASLVDYKLGARTPVSRIGKFNEALKKLTRVQSSPVQDPSVGLPIEKLMGTRKTFREAGLKQQAKGLASLPKLDFELEYMGNVHSLNRIRDEGIVTDTIDLSNFTHKSEDSELTQDFTVLHGPITRSGDFDYIKNGNIVTYQKKWDNLKQIFPQYDYLPLKATAKKGAHQAEIEGYTSNWEFNEDTEEVEADVVLFNDIHKHLDLSQLKEDYHVSIGFNDIIKDDNSQIITSLDHLAMSLGEEKGRACTGTNEKGASCSTVKPIHDQNLEVVN